jgi:hypothetical protein
MAIINNCGELNENFYKNDFFIDNIFSNNKDFGFSANEQSAVIQEGEKSRINLKKKKSYIIILTFKGNSSNDDDEDTGEDNLDGSQHQEGQVKEFSILNPKRTERSVSSSQDLNFAMIDLTEDKNKMGKKERENSSMSESMEIKKSEESRGSRIHSSKYNKLLVEAQKSKEESGYSKVLKEKEDFFSDFEREKIQLKFSRGSQFKRKVTAEIVKTEE